MHTLLLILTNSIPASPSELCIKYLVVIPSLTPLHSKMLLTPRLAVLLPVWLFLSEVGAKVPRVAHPGSKQAKYLASKRPSTTTAQVSGSFTGAGWSASAPEVSAPYANIWQELSNDEAADVIAFLHNQTDLNLTAAADAGR